MYVLPLGITAFLFIAFRAYYQGLVLAILAPFVVAQDDVLVLVAVCTVSVVYGRLRAVAMDGDAR